MYRSPRSKYDTLRDIRAHYGGRMTINADIIMKICQAGSLVALLHRHSVPWKILESEVSIVFHSLSVLNQ